MSSLTIEMGLRRKRGNSPPVPDMIAVRDDVTLAQKQRLAVLAKMGLGSVSGAAPPIRDVPQYGTPVRDMPSRGPSMVDRKAALLDKERRFREQEERQQELEAREEQARRDQVAKRRGGGGIARLGPVQPREDDIPQFLPAPMQVPPPKAETKMEIKISKETAERAKGAIEKAAEQPPEDETDDEEEAAEDQVLAFLRLEKAKKAKAAKVPTEAPKAKPAKRKRKRTRGVGEEGDEGAGEDDDLGDEDGEEAYDPYLQVPPVVRHRDGGVNKHLMVVESVKGKVSTANRNFTDADLERRFSVPDAQGHGGSLMTEEEVLRMIRREKMEKGTAGQGSASRRVQRELAEWAAAKEQQRARVKSPHRFERMVVSRK